MDLEDRILVNIIDICFFVGKIIWEKRLLDYKMKVFLNRMKICVCRLKGFIVF